MKLETLDLSHNSMSCLFSDLDIQKLRRLKVLDLSYNNLYGSIEGLCTMQALVELGLSSNKFNDQIPECLSILRNLQVLDLSQNLFSGNFPSFISNITSLVYLSLFDNYLQGSFSLSSLANHSKLQVLYISSQSPKVQVETEKAQWFPTFQLKSLILRSCNLNMDKGSIVPSFLQYQKGLQFIDLSHNKLVGAFPSWLIQNNSRLEYFLVMNNLFVGNLQLSSIRQDIVHLDISNNNVSGSLPEDIGAFLPGIIKLNLSMNNFEGSIPTSIGKMQELSSLDLSHNRFSGELPEQLATGCISLQQLRLSNNLFHGNSPKFSTYTFLTDLFLNDNNLNCTLNEVLENLNGAGLMKIDISNNSISGEIPSSIVKLSRVWILLMGNNQLEGEIPSELFTLTMLFILDLSQNRLSGSISHVNPSILRFLYLQKNAFSGSIPLTLLEGSNLVTLDLRDNNFSGNIPYWIDKLSSLRVLSLGGNNFIGHIPIQLCQLQKITIMDVSRNKLKGSIPSCFNNLSFGMEENDYLEPTFQFETLTVNSPIGSFIDANVSLFRPLNDVQEDDVKAIVEFRTKNNFYFYSGNILGKMTGMDLSCNILTGSIPFQIGHMQQIRALNLSHNCLSGSIPYTFSNLTQIESLDLSYNNLSGEIPSQLTKLNTLAIFNVSYNNLSGIAPSTGQFGTFVEDSYRGNPFLCAPLLKRQCEGSPPPSQFNNTEGKEPVLDMVAFYWSFAASYITILLGFTTVLCINAYWRMTWFYFIAKIIRKCFPTLPLY
ncbi:LRR receptor serine/threonine-protein kinase GSO2 [Spatholobus suberectus]|nr:LRR receptor serine/threonine-protein kinase GSO2 [Spatholobus suberectus]